MTVSSSRYDAVRKGAKPADESGDVAESELKKLGHRVAKRELVSDDRGMIRARLESFLAGRGDVIVFMGGTGVSTRDVTIETVRPYLEKELDGFGELFRALSFEEIGAAAALTRCTAGVARGKLVVCLPGSPEATALALERLGGEFPHAVHISRT